MQRAPTDSRRGRAGELPWSPSGTVESTEEEPEATCKQSSVAAEKLPAAGSPVHVVCTVASYPQVHVYPEVHVASYPQVHVAGCPHFREGSNEPSSCVVHRLRRVVVQKAVMERKVDDPSTARAAAATAEAGYSTAQPAVAAQVSVDHGNRD